MTIFNVFLDFITRVLSIQFLGFRLIDYMITFAIITIIFKVIGTLGKK